MVRDVVAAEDLSTTGTSAIVPISTELPLLAIRTDWSAFRENPAYQASLTTESKPGELEERSIEEG
jgi:hypothetical protein